MRLRIGPIIEQADELARTVVANLPDHPGLQRTTQLTADAARNAQKLHVQRARLIGLHRLPPIFLVIAVLLLLGWTWVNFLRWPSVIIAMPGSDASNLRYEASIRPGIRVIETGGSEDSLARLRSGDVDFAFVQGGVPIDSVFLRDELPGRELVLAFARPSIIRPSDVRVILTTARGQGSHHVLNDLLRMWGTEDKTTIVFGLDDTLMKSPVASEIDAVFAVKEPNHPWTKALPVWMRNNGFQFLDLDLGVFATTRDYLEPVVLRPGDLHMLEGLPPKPSHTYWVRTYLAARSNLSPRHLALARTFVDPGSRKLDETGSLRSIGEASELLQGVEAFLGICVYIGVAFLALLGLDILLYRTRFHELNSLISLVSIHQSTKDVIGRDEATKLHNIDYLRICSDTLNLISAITGYYAQENSSLLYNKLLEIIPQRADALKLNIQLKILQAVVDTPVVPTSAPPCCGRSIESTTTPSQASLSPAETESKHRRFGLRRRKWHHRD